MISGCAPQNTAVAGASGGVCWSCRCFSLVIRCFSLVWLVPLILHAGAALFANEQKCAGICSALHVPMQRAAMPDGARCTCQRSALRFPAEKTAVRRAAWQVGLHASLSTCREFLPPGRTVQSAFLLFPPRNAGRAVLPFFCKSRGQAHAVAWPGLVGVLRKAEWLPVRGVGVCQSSLR